MHFDADFAPFYQALGHSRDLNDIKICQTRIAQQILLESSSGKAFTGQGAAIETTTAAGKLVFGIFAALAEFERDLMSEPAVAGLASARARGHTLGLGAIRPAHPGRKTVLLGESQQWRVPPVAAITIHITFKNIGLKRIQLPESGKACRITGLGGESCIRI